MNVLMVFALLLLTLSSYGRDLFEARNQAMQILMKASQNPISPNLRQVYQNLIRQVGTVEIIIPKDGTDHEPCINTERLAYRLKKRPEVFICRQTLSESDLYIAQVLIHESAHIEGYDDECVATSFEITALFAAGYVPLNHSYMRACGFLKTQPLK